MIILDWNVKVDSPFFIRGRLDQWFHVITMFNNSLFNTCIGFSTPHQNMYFHPGMIHSSLEWFFPDWNESFQSKLPDSGKSSISRQGIELRKNSFRSNLQILNLNFGNRCHTQILVRPWKESFQPGIIYSRMEWFVPEWNESFRSGKT